MSYQADTLRDTIDTNWGLTGRVAKAGSASAGEYPVYIFAFAKSIIQEVSTRKAVEIRKTTPLQNIIRHPRFSVINDTFEIACYYELSDIDSSVWDLAEQDVEDMCDEVTRIINTVYNPSTGTGMFFTVNQSWDNQDSPLRS